MPYTVFKLSPLSVHDIRTLFCLYFRFAIHHTFSFVDSKFVKMSATNKASLHRYSRRHSSPVSEKEFSDWFDSDGRLVKEAAMREALFHGKPTNMFLYKGTV